MFEVILASVLVAIAILGISWISNFVRFIVWVVNELKGR